MFIKLTEFEWLKVSQAMNCYRATLKREHDDLWARRSKDLNDFCAFTHKALSGKINQTLLVETNMHSQTREIFAEYKENYEGKFVVTQGQALFMLECLYNYLSHNRLELQKHTESTNGYMAHSYSSTIEDVRNLIGKLHGTVMYQTMHSTITTARYIEESLPGLGEHTEYTQRMNA
ncbi:MAG: hypothetical protein Unbinned2716contig1001_33 [Prokaryotic dsDNA virus sp.]|nr:MAG: hypothetical protein Unbinned2716contig1001_33 [Prokaryotic dsDNA virus sp.]|tara:strand:+ start:1298 stop:1825 length:528 start_codon:yes stop_codon:yes gene_type:complete